MGMFPSLKKLLYILFLFLPILGRAQIIATIAGTGDSLGLGDGGSAINCDLKHPWITALDTAGNLYIADREHNRIRKVNASGVITTIAGTGTAGFNGDGIAATNAAISDPRGLAVDLLGNIYICDFDNRRLRKVNAAGIITTVAGTGNVWYNGDNMPATNANIGPSCVAIDGSGNLYIGDGTNNRLRMVNASGIITTIAGDGTFTTYTGNGGSATAASIGPPCGIAVDVSGNVFLACIAYNVVCKINTSGTITAVAGTGPAGPGVDNIPATSASLRNPAGLALDDSNNLYICDTYHSRVRKVNSAGIITTYAGKGTMAFSGDGGPAAQSELDRPSGVTIDKRGNVYITDWGNNRIRYVDNHKNVSVNNVKDHVNAVAVYPNPSHNEITITATDIIENVAVVNISGQVVSTAMQASPRDEVLVNIAPLPTGIYFVKVNGVYAGRFVKE